MYTLYVDIMYECMTAAPEIKFLDTFNKLGAQYYCIYGISLRAGIVRRRRTAV